MERAICEPDELGADEGGAHARGLRAFGRRVPYRRGRDVDIAVFKPASLGGAQGSAPDSIRPTDVFSCHLIPSDIGDDDRADRQLSAVRIADTHPLLEAERRLQPRHRRSSSG